MAPSTNRSNSEQTSPNLARVRDNQRRSRARRKQYLSDLEGKYRRCEQVGTQASAQIQAAARRVLDENRRLRELLRRSGVRDAEIDGHAEAEAAGALESLLEGRWECGGEEVRGGTPMSMPSPSPLQTPQQKACIGVQSCGAREQSTAAVAAPACEDSSSCRAIASAIRAVRPDLGPELEVQLGCRDGGECSVSNLQAFEVLDRVSDGRG